MQSRSIPDASITASSYQVSPRNSRLFTLEENGEKGAWVPSKEDQYPWLQIDLGSVYIVTNIATRYVKQYSISYSHTGQAYEAFTINGQKKVKK
jgi:hypothetical protein